MGLSVITCVCVLCMSKSVCMYLYACVSVCVHNYVCVSMYVCMCMSVSVCDSLSVCVCSCSVCAHLVSLYVFACTVVYPELTQSYLV